MINSMQKAIILKDFKSVTTNKNLMTALIIVPLVFTVVMPIIFIAAIHFAPEQTSDFEEILGMLPEEMKSDNMSETIIVFLLNNIMPVFFTLIPIMASSIMAASSFVGEKEKRTLETLLYSPLTLTQIFQSKVWASFLLSMTITFSSFIIMVIVVETAVLLTLGHLIIPGISWIITILVVAPSVSLLAIVFIIKGSAKAQTMEESQQRAIFLIMPLLLLIIGQFTGLVMINAWYLLIIGGIAGLVAWLLMMNSMKKFTYELLLKR